MESIELCASLSRFIRTDAAGPSLASDASARSEVRAALDAVTAFYDDAAAPEPLASVDDMLLATLQRLLLTTLRDADFATQERAFMAAALLIRRCQSRLPAARVLDLLQTCVVYLPTPAAAVSSHERTKLPPSPPEELSLATLQFIDVLLSGAAAASAVRQLTQTQDSTHFLAYAVSSLLQLAERERNRGLALQALEVLQCLLRHVAEPRVLRTFFPGVSASMWKVMSAPQQSSKVAVASLDCLTFSMSACLGGTTSTSALGTQYSLERLRCVQKASPPLTPPDTAMVDEDPWLTQAADKVEILLSLILSSKAMDRHAWRVRRALVDLCGAVLLECRHALQTSFFRCFEELMVLRTHAMPEVAQPAADALRSIQSSLPLPDWIALEPQLGERFHMQLSMLALQSSTEHESVSVHTMEVLIGYLQFQGLRIRSFLDENMISIFKTLRQVLEFDGFDSDVVRHNQVQMRQESDAVSVQTLVLPYFRKRFRYFHDETSVSTAIRLLRNLGATATPAVVVDTAITLLLTDGDVGKERQSAVLVIMSECLRSLVDIVSNAGRDNIHLVGRVLDDLLELPLWSSEERGDKNAAALAVECVGVCVELVKVGFHDFLLHVLYPLVEKLGDPAVQVEQAALSTLQRIAIDCGHEGDLHTLFSANMDYFVDALCARLEQIDVYPQSPQVIEALLRHATIASLPLIDEITQSLMRAVDEYQAEAHVTTVLLRSLHMLLGSYVKRREAESKTEHMHGAWFAAEKSPLSLFLLEMRAMTGPFRFESSDESNTMLGKEKLADTKSAMPVEFGDDEQEPGSPSSSRDKNTQSEDYEQDPSPLPFQTQTVAILERCSYFVSDEDPVTCCLVLATIEQGVRYLRSRRKVLLPLIHRIWPSILHRLSVTNRPILTATMDLLATLAECAGDFIGDRFVETIWPSTKLLLASLWASKKTTWHKETALLSRSMLLLSVQGSSDELQQGQNDPSTSTGTPHFAEASEGRATLDVKFANAALRCLRVVSENATNITSIVPEVVQSCTPFLSQIFPPSTRRRCQKLLVALGGLNGDEVFVQMASAAHWQPAPPPSSSFPAIHCEKGVQSAQTGREESTRASAAYVLKKLATRDLSS